MNRTLSIKFTFWFLVLAVFVFYVLYSLKFTGLFLYKTASSNALSQNISQGTTTNTENQTLFVTMQYFGRLGNRMFTYASLLGIAHANNRQLIARRDDLLRVSFKLKRAVFNTSIPKFPIVREKYGVAFDKKLMRLPAHHVEVYGLTQSFKYFFQIEDVIREEFTFLDSVEIEAAKILDNIRIKQNGSLIVGVHVRRTDFLEEKHQKAGYMVPEKSYFIKAFNWFRSKFADRQLTFVVASDDLSWCKSNLNGTDVIVVPSASMSVHMAVLAGCDHVIISGGTFGWWCGWLAGGYVIHFTGFIPENKDLARITTKEDYFPPLWIGLGN